MKYPAPLTRTERDHLRRLVDQARRVRVAAYAPPKDSGKPRSRRADYWNTYYHANRDRILQQRRAREATA